MEEGRNDYKHEESKSTYIPSLEILVLTDREANKCYLWNVDKKTSIVVEDERLKKPMGVCATSSGLICVCFSATHYIVLISPTGKALGSFKLTTHCPYYVVVSRDDKHLLVFTAPQKEQRQLHIVKLI